jgi:branched-chain amino acid transport system permease protein
MRARELVALAAIVSALLAAPSLFDVPPYALHILTLAAIYSVTATGLNLMLGFAGLVSLGHAAFAGIGGYTLGILMVDARLGFWPSLASAATASGIAGAAVGILCLRLRTHFFMIVTLAFGLILHAVMNNWDSVTRGAVGLAGVPRPETLALAGVEIAFRRLADFSRLAVAVAALAFVAQALIVRSEFGRILSAIRQDEILASSKGVNVAACKIAVFALGSAIGGVGGAMKVTFLRVAAPASFDMLESINLVLIVIVGGAGTLLGPILGAILYVALPEFLRMADALRLVIFGLLLVILMLYAPRGLGGWLEMLWRRRIRPA